MLRHCDNSTMTGSPQHDPRGYGREKDAAAYLSVSPRTIRYMVKRRQIPAYQISRGLTLYKYSDLDEALKRYRTRAIGEELA
jgi:excisionase family DNA binding protein